MKAREMIERWNISFVKTGETDKRKQIQFSSYANVEAIKENLQGIVAELEKMENEKIKRGENIKAIEGLRELKSAINAEERYRHEFDRRMEDEMLSSIAPDKPKVSVQELKAKYPRAAAYIKAESWKNSSNVRKYNAGKKALERIVAGEDYEQVLADMEAEWTEYTRTRMWD